MKRTAIKATVLAAMISAQAGEAGAADYKTESVHLGL